MPATTGMKGGGYYDRHSTAHLSSIQALQDWVDDAVANMPLPAQSRPVTVLDLGSSEGRNAVRLTTPASCVPSPSRWYGRHSTSRRGKSRPLKVCTSAFEPVCSPSRSVTRGALSRWLHC
jgi:hypothetical protein